MVLPLWILCRIARGTLGGKVKSKRKSLFVVTTYDRLVRRCRASSSPFVAYLRCVVRFLRKDWEAKSKAKVHDWDLKTACQKLDEQLLEDAYKLLADITIASVLVFTVQIVQQYSPHPLALGLITDPKFPIFTISHMLHCFHHFFVDLHKSGVHIISFRQT